MKVNIDAERVRAELVRNIAGAGGMDDAVIMTKPKKAIKGLAKKYTEDGTRATAANLWREISRDPAGSWFARKSPRA